MPGPDHRARGTVPRPVGRQGAHGGGVRPGVPEGVMLRPWRILGVARPAADGDAATEQTARRRKRRNLPHERPDEQRRTGYGRHEAGDPRHRRCFWISFVVPQHAIRPQVHDARGDRRPHQCLRVRRGELEDRHDVRCYGEKSNQRYSFPSAAVYRRSWPAVHEWPWIHEGNIFRGRIAMVSTRMPDTLLFDMTSARAALLAAALLAAACDMRGSGAGVPQVAGTYTGTLTWEWLSYENASYLTTARLVVRQSGDEVTVVGSIVVTGTTYEIPALSGTINQTGRFTVSPQGGASLVPAVASTRNSGMRGLSTCRLLPVVWRPIGQGRRKHPDDSLRKPAGVRHADPLSARGVLHG